jgi:hypothetical protein
LVAGAAGESLDVDHRPGFWDDDTNRQVVGDHRLGVAPASDARQLARQRGVEMGGDTAMRLTRRQFELMPSYADCVALQLQFIELRASCVELQLKVSRVTESGRKGSRSSRRAARSATS